PNGGLILGGQRSRLIPGQGLSLSSTPPLLRLNGPELRLGPLIPMSFFDSPRPRPRLPSLSMLRLGLKRSLTNFDGVFAPPPLPPSSEPLEPPEPPSSAAVAVSSAVSAIRRASLMIATAWRPSSAWCAAFCAESTTGV